MTHDTSRYWQLATNEDGCSQLPGRTAAETRSCSWTVSPAAVTACCQHTATTHQYSGPGATRPDHGEKIKRKKNKKWRFLKAEKSIFVEQCGVKWWPGLYFKCIVAVFLRLLIHCFALSTVAQFNFKVLMLPQSYFDIKLQYQTWNYLQ